MGCQPPLFGQQGRVGDQLCPVLRSTPFAHVDLERVVENRGAQPQHHLTGP